ncbi:MAG: ABC transporter ATP-binding protein [Lachnospiraceae bacterium]|nr:ABC transporter ATP-binding protein [Lachnospiraceae bacterium]
MPIEMKQIKKSYKDQRVLTNFSLLIEDGEKICLMGESGIGKTTILRILAGLTKPDSGEISGLQGKKVSMVFQEERLLEWADAFENVALVLNQKRFGTGKKARKTAIANFLLQEFHAVGLHGYEKKPVAQLSGGMRRRIAIVRALCAEGEILLLDEPFTGLDATTKMRAAEYLKSRAEGRTVIMVTHDLQEAIQIGARVVMVENKKVVCAKESN